MRLSLVLASALASLALVALASAVLDLSFSRAALLAPVIVFGVGAAVGLFVVWGKAALEPLRARSRRR
jgi:hypothetical protein